MNGNDTLKMRQENDEQQDISTHGGFVVSISK